MTLPPLALLMLWSLWILQAGLSALQVRRFARRMDYHGKKSYAAYRPKAWVVVPFKGVDPELAANVRALCEQDYPDYELVLVVDSAQDPAHGVLQGELARHPQRRATVLVAGPAGPTEGQKIHNQLAAIDHLEPRSGDQDVWVFADSDAVPGSGWLAWLVQPLLQRRNGMTTGYRWLVPMHGAQASVWSHVASVINSSVACFLGRYSFNHAWGGSMALRVETARRGDLRGSLVGALCDDYQFTRMVRRLGLRVMFVPKCLVATPVDFTWSTLVNFVHRQYLLTRVYAPRLYRGAVYLTTLYVAGCVSALAYLIWSAVRQPGQGLWLWPVGVTALVFGLDQLRARMRRRVVQRAFGAEMLQAWGKTLAYDRWGTPLWMAVHWLLVVRSAFGRTMNWRGLRYRLYAPQRVRRLD